MCFDNDTTSGQCQLFQSECAKNINSNEACYRNFKTLLDCLAYQKIFKTQLNSDFIGNIVNDVTLVFGILAGGIGTVVSEAGAAAAVTTASTQIATKAPELASVVEGAAAAVAEGVSQPFSAASEAVNEIVNQIISNAVDLGDSELTATVEAAAEEAQKSATDAANEVSLTRETKPPSADPSATVPTNNDGSVGLLNPESKTDESTISSTPSLKRDLS